MKKAYLFTPTALMLIPIYFMSMLGLSFIKEILLEDLKIIPSVLLNKLKAKIISELNQKDDESLKEGMDMSVARINLNTRQMQYAGANNPIYYTKGEEVLEIKATKQPIGYNSKNMNFENHVIDLEKDAMVYLFSDGFADQFGGPRNKKIGYKKLRELLLLQKNFKLKDQENNIRTFFENWKDSEEQIDDVCLVGMRI